jgi:hypothetical protein
MSENVCRPDGIVSVYPAALELIFAIWPRLTGSPGKKQGSATPWSEH